MDFDTFIQKIHQREDLDSEAITRAYYLAERTHAHQKRKSGEPYILHPVAVANIILEIGGDETMICAALLHDTIEDALNPSEVDTAIEEGFGKEVYYLVHALSKNADILDKHEQQEHFFQQMEEALQSDISVFFLKMADLIHNLQTIDGLKPEKKEIWVRELRERYIPLFQDHYHQVALPYHKMYQEIMEELEKTLEMSI